MKSPRAQRDCSSGFVADGAVAPARLRLRADSRVVSLSDGRNLGLRSPHRLTQHVTLGPPFLVPGYDSISRAGYAVKSV
jgi:hypothetical protein